MLPESVLAKMVEALHLKLVGEGAKAQLLQFAMSVIKGISSSQPELAGTAVAVIAAAASGVPCPLAC